MALVDTSLTRSPRVQAGSVVAAGLATGLLTPLAQTLSDHVYLLRSVGGTSMALGGLPFALLVIAIVRLAARADWWRALVLGVVTLVAFDAAIAVAANTSSALTGSPEPIRNILAGLAGGFVGSGLMSISAALLRVGARRARGWLIMIAVGTGLGALLAVDFYLRSDDVWVLFPVWQAGVAVALLRALRDSRAIGEAS